MHNVDEVPKTAPQAVKLPDNQRVAFPERLKACSKARSVVFFSTRSVTVEVSLAHARSEQRFFLWDNISSRS
jgi:hypothetical protein